MRDTAARATTPNQPTNRAPNEPAIDKNANFGPIWVAFEEGQRTWSRPELRRNGRFYVQPKSSFWPENGFYPKKSPKITFSPLIIWAKALFSLNNFFRSWPEHGLPEEVGLFLGPKIFGPNIRFLPYDHNFSQ